jgi:FkbM family methyltransferase
VTFTYYPQNTVLSGRFADKQAETDVVKRYLANDAAAPSSGAALDELLAHNLRSEQYECSIRRLSDIIRQEAIDHIDLLKIDVEKAEWDVLSGIDDSDWPKIRQVVIEVHDVDGRLSRVLDLLTRHGFESVAEEESMLAGTGLYAVYAKRPGVGAPAPASNDSWHGATALRDELMRHMARTLPDYMVPSAIVFMHDLPLTSSGKLDRRALPAPHLAAPVDDTPPQGPIEEVVASVWRQALQIDRVGRSTSFFDLGGHSLLVTRVVAALAKLLRVQLPMRAMFDSPTVADVAAALVARESAPGITQKIAQLVLKLQSQAPAGTHA